MYSCYISILYLTWFPYLITIHFDHVFNFPNRCLSTFGPNCAETNLLRTRQILLWNTGAQFGKGELSFCLRATLRRDFETYSRTRCHLHCYCRLRRPHVCVCPDTLLPASFHPMLLLQRHRSFSGRCLYCFCFVGWTGYAVCVFTRFRLRTLCDADLSAVCVRHSR